MSSIYSTNILANETLDTVIQTVFDGVALGVSITNLLLWLRHIPKSQQKHRVSLLYLGATLFWVGGVTNDIIVGARPDLSNQASSFTCIALYGLAEQCYTWCLYFALITEFPDLKETKALFLRLLRYGCVFVNTASAIAWILAPLSFQTDTFAPLLSYATANQVWVISIFLNTGFDFIMALTMVLEFVKRFVDLLKEQEEQQKIHKLQVKAATRRRSSQFSGDSPIDVTLRRRSIYASTSMAISAQGAVLPVQEEAESRKSQTLSIEDRIRYRSQGEMMGKRAPSISAVPPVPSITIKVPPAVVSEEIAEEKEISVSTFSILWENRQMILNSTYFYLLVELILALIYIIDQFIAFALWTPADALGNVLITLRFQMFLEFAAGLLIAENFRQEQKQMEHQQHSASPKNKNAIPLPPIAVKSTEIIP